jgi:hypothetical protein
MTMLTIKDLALNDEVDRDAVAGVRGGFGKIFFLPIPPELISAEANHVASPEVSLIN